MGGVAAASHAPRLVPRVAVLRGDSTIYDIYHCALAILSRLHDGAALLLGPGAALLALPAHVRHGEGHAGPGTHLRPRAGHHLAAALVTEHPGGRLLHVTRDT